VKSWKILKIGILKAFEVEDARRFDNTVRLEKESLLKNRRRKLEQLLIFLKIEVKDQYA
jgi:hypothetical protein